MVLEFCEMGQLDAWLLKQNGKADEETMEKLYRFSRDIACGMSYLASKKVSRERTVLDIPTVQIFLLVVREKKNILWRMHAQQSGEDEIWEYWRIDSR